MKTTPLLAGLLALPACGKAPPPRPDILVITLDTLRADVLGCYGNKSKPSPTLDRLAGEGVRFDRAYTVTPLTIPAHSSLFTGLFPPRHQVRDNGDFFLSDGATTLAEMLREAGYATMASVGAEVTSHHWGFAQGFDAFFDDMGSAPGEEVSRWRVERPADAVVADALAWFAARDPAAGPWFSWVHLFDVHHPYEPPEPHASRYATHPYLGEVSWTDAQVGVLLDALQAAGHLDDAWVLVMGDHGEGLGAHGEGMHGVLLYDATTRIPLIVRPPAGLSEARVVTDPVSLVDVVPTVRSLVGLAPEPGLDGLDLAPVLRGEETLPPDRTVYLESLYAWRHYGWAPQKGLVDATHKLIHSTTPEVYAAGDRGETRDLAPGDPGLLATLAGRLEHLEQGFVASDGAAEAADLSPERLSQLEALGYVTTTLDPGAPTEGLPDPVSRLPVLKVVEEARQAIQTGDLAAAEARLRSVLEQEPGLGEARVMLGTLRARQGDLDGALALLHALDQDAPSSPVRALMGSILLQRGDAPAAVGLLQQALDTDPYLASAWQSYLHALFLVGDLPRLDAELARARAHVPGAVGVRAMEGVLLALQGDVVAAEPVLLEVLARDPGQPFCNLALGLVRRAQGRMEEAETAFLEEARLFESVPARRSLVEIYAEQRRFPEQLEQLQAVVAVEPPDLLTAHSLAQVLFNLRRYPEARDAVTDCRRLDSRYPACAMLEANVLSKLGEAEAAQAAYQEALRLAGEVTGADIDGARP